MGEKLVITNQVVCVLCGGVNPGAQWLGMPRHAECSPPSEVSASYKGYSILAGLPNDAVRDLCRQLGVRFTYRYRNANGNMSRLFHDRSYLIYQIVRVKGISQIATSSGGASGGAQGKGGDGAKGGDESKGDKGKGDESKGDDAKGKGDESKGDESKGDESKGDESKGDESKGDKGKGGRIEGITLSWVQMVQRMRDAAVKRGLKIVISPRASQRGSKLLARGLDLGNVAMVEIGNRLDATAWANLQADAGVSIPKPVGNKHRFKTHKQTDLLTSLVDARINAWLKGPAGSGKSTAAYLAAKSCGLPFYFTGAIDSEYKLTGFVDAQGRIVNTQFRRAFTEGGVFLFDEIDRSLPNALLAFNAMLANGWADFPGMSEPVMASPNFVGIVGANTAGSGGTVEYSGAYKQDAAFCDRFSMILWDYDLDLETEIALDAAGVL